MRTTPLRRAFTATAAALTALPVLLVSGAPPAAAAPPVREEVVVGMITDVQVPTAAGLAVLDVYLTTQRGGVGLMSSDRSVVYGTTDEDFAVAVTDDAATGSGPLYDAVTGEPLTTVEYDLDIVETGTEVVRTRKSIGNHADLETQTVTHLRATGTLTLFGQSYAVDGTGFTVRYSFFFNAPASEVGNDTAGSMSAVVPGEDGRLLVLTGTRDHFTAAVVDPDGELLLLADSPEGSTVLQPDGLHGVLLVDDGSGGPPVERRVDVAGELSRDKVRTVEQRPNGEVHLTTQTITLRGSLDLAPGSSFDVDGVQGEWTRARWAYRSTGS